MFYRTIADNLRVGRPEATDEELDRSGEAGRGARLHPAPAEGLRHARRRARHHAVGRRAPAHRHRPGVAEGPADPDPRRGDQRARRRDRGAGAEGAEDADAGAHDLHHRPSAVDGPRGRPDPGVPAAAASSSAARFRELVARGGIFADLVHTQLGPADATKVEAAVRDVAALSGRHPRTGPSRAQPGLVPKPRRRRRRPGRGDPHESPPPRASEPEVRGSRTQ